MIIPRTTQIGDPVIRSKSRPVKNLKSVRTIVRDLVDSMRHHHLVGMAAPQISVPLRIFVSEIKKTSTRRKLHSSDLDPLRVFINPKIIQRSKTMEARYEGCGSVAESGLFGKVPRHRQVIVSALDEEGERFHLTATGLLARVIQHEIDHLDGKVFLDRMKDMSSLMGREEFMSAKKK